MSLSPDTPFRPEALKAALDALATELQSPSKLQGLPPNERLKEALAELSIREKDLLAAVGIARVMVGRMEEVEKDLRDSMRGKEEAEGVVGGLRRENEMLSETLSALSTRCSLLESELSATDNQLTRLQHHAHQLQVDLDSLSSRPDACCELKAAFLSEVDTLTKNYASELKSTNREKRRLERENQDLLRENDRLRELISKRDSSLGQLESELARCRGKAARLLDENTAVVRRLYQAEDASKFLEFDLVLALRKVEKLEEDLKVMLNSTCQEGVRMHGRHTSMVSKLPGILEDDEVDTVSDTEDPTSSGHTQCSYRREISLDFGYETADEELFSLRKEGSEGRTRYSFMEVGTMGIDRVGGVSVTGRRGLPALSVRRFPYPGKPQSILASFLRRHRIWAVLQTLYILAYRYLRKPR